MTPTRTWAAAMIVVFALALSVAACGGDDDGGDGESDAAETQAATSPFDRDACELLTEAEVEQALGEPVEGEFTEGDESTSTPGQCNWAKGDNPVNLADPSQTPSAITLLLGDPQIFDNSRILAEDGDDYEALDGVGDDAYAGNGVGGVRIADAGITVTPIGVDVNNPATHDLIVELVSQVAANY